MDKNQLGDIKKTKKGFKKGLPKGIKIFLKKKKKKVAKWSGTIKKSS